jgi:hypothetical protein
MALEPGSATVSRTPRKGRKYFKLEEANRSLTYVSRVVEDITGCYRQAVEIRQRLERPHPEDNAEQLRSRYELAMDKLNELIDELHQVGVELKDFDKGLVDFPAIHEGREVLLCWHRGEKTIQAWHEVDAGFAGRQDIATFKEG